MHSAATGLPGFGCQEPPIGHRRVSTQMGLQGQSGHPYARLCGRAPSKSDAAGASPPRCGIIQEATPVKKESHGGVRAAGRSVHHGCWATTVVLPDQRVNRVRYRFVPSSVDTPAVAAKKSSPNCRNDAAPTDATAAKGFSWLALL